MGRAVVSPRSTRLSQGERLMSTLSRCGHSRRCVFAHAPRSNFGRCCFHGDTPYMVLRMCWGYVTRSPVAANQRRKIRSRAHNTMAPCCHKLLSWYTLSFGYFSGCDSFLSRCTSTTAAMRSSPRACGRSRLSTSTLAGPRLTSAGGRTSHKSSRK